MRLALYTFLLCFSFSRLSAQQALTANNNTSQSIAREIKVFKDIPMSASIMTVDDLGNVYVVKDKNNLVRYTENGDSSAFFRSVQNGEIGAVDASNPLKVVVYYPQYGKAVILDRMLALKNELDLKRLNIASSTVVASSADGNLWVYDRFNSRLIKIDEQLNQVGKSNDLRQEINKVPAPVFMKEGDRKLFMSDTTLGILTFDRYGNYINTLSIYGVKYLQVFGSQILYQHGDSLFSWDITSARSDNIIIPSSGQKIINSAIVRNNLYVLYPDKLVYYKLRKE
jgi:hypothetical protein